MKQNKLKAIYVMCVILIILGFIGRVNATPYSQVSILDNVTQTSSLYSYSFVHYNITLYNLSRSEFNVSLPSNVENLTLINNNHLNLTERKYPVSDCHTFSLSVGCSIIQINGVKNGNTISFSYDYYQNYSGINDSFNSTIYFMPSSFTSLLVINMILPTGAYLPNNDYNVPAATLTYVNNRFDVKWQFINQSFPNLTNYYIDLPFTIEYNLNIQNKPKANTNYYIYLTAGLVLLLIAVGLLYFYRYSSKRRKTRPDNTNKRNTGKVRFMLDLLNHDEKLVLDTINKNGFTYQSDIIKKTNFSKIKISKIISKLSRYRLIKIKQDGRTNKIKRI